MLRTIWFRIRAVIFIGGLLTASLLVSVGGPTRPAYAAAVFTDTPPVVDGMVSAGEWDFAQVEFDTGARPDPNGTGDPAELAGARGRFGWDNSNIYGLTEAYPNTGGMGNNANGPFDNMNWEVYINALGFPAAVFLDTTAADNNHAGSTVAFGTIDPVSGLARMVIEFSVPITTIIDSTGVTFRRRTRLIPRPISWSIDWRLRIPTPQAASTAVEWRPG